MSDRKAGYNIGVRCVGFDATLVSEVIDAILTSNECGVRQHSSDHNEEWNPEGNQPQVRQPAASPATSR